MNDDNHVLEVGTDRPIGSHFYVIFMSVNIVQKMKPKNVWDQNNSELQGRKTHFS